MTISYVLAQAAPGTDYGFFLMIGGMFLIMYLFMIRPQMKKQKEAKSFREAIKKGDKVVTIGGIHGKVGDVSDRTVLLLCESGKLRVEKTAVNPSGESSEEAVQQNA